MWGRTGLVYDTAKVAGGKIDDTWKELFEPRQDFVGKIGMLKDMGEVITAAEYYLGLDQCTEKAEDGQKILELLEKQKPAVKVYNAEGTVHPVPSRHLTTDPMSNPTSPPPTTP